MTHKTLDSLIEYYVKHELKEKNKKTDINATKAAIEKLAEDVINEIVDEKKEEYEKQILTQMKTEFEKRKVRQLKVFMIESIILAFFVGCLVNQSSDLISILKNLINIQYLNIIITLILILIFVCIIHFIIKLRYLDNIIEFFKKIDDY